MQIAYIITGLYLIIFLFLVFAAASAKTKDGKTLSLFGMGCVVTLYVVSIWGIGQVIGL